MKIDKLLLSVVAKPCIKAVPLLLLMPLLMTGCMTAGVVHDATHEVELYREAEIKRVEKVEKVVLIPQGKVIALFEGMTAGASKVGRFTVTATLPGSNALSRMSERDVEMVRVPASAVAQGWHPPEGPGLLPVEVVFPVVLTGYGTAPDEPDQFPGVQGSQRTLYVVASQKFRRELSLVYVVPGAHPSKVFFYLEPKMETRAHNYPLLLLLPVTVAGDLVTLPLQVIFLWNLGH